MAAWELEAAYEDALAELGALISRTLFGPDATQRTLQLRSSTVELTEDAANDLVRALARCSLAPSPALTWRSNDPSPADLGLSAFWATSSLDSDPLPSEALGDHAAPLSILEETLTHLERLHDLARAHLPEASRRPVLSALSRVRDAFRDALPADGSLVGRSGTTQRGLWIRQAGAVLAAAVEATGLPAPSSDDLGHPLADLLEALSPDEAPADPASIARVLRNRSR